MLADKTTKGKYVPVAIYAKPMSSYLLMLAIGKFDTRKKLNVELN
jgi:hypothetical protein